MPADPNDVRAALPSLGRETYLNTGAAGPLAGPAARAIAEVVSASVLASRKSYTQAMAAVDRHEALRTAVGAPALSRAPRALGVDAYALPAQKWLLGPEGLGALWVAPEAMERIDLTATGDESGTDHTTAGRVLMHPGARRYEVSTEPDLLVPGWLASLEWLRGLGWEWIHARVRAAAAAARLRLGALPGVRILTPPGDHGGLVTFRVDGADPEAASDRLAERSVIVRWVPWPRALRVSAGFFTDDADLDRLAAGVAALR